MDILNDILDTLDLKGVLYFRTDFSGPWAVTVPSYEAAARFHLVVQGSCHVTVEGCDPVILTPGDIILIPRGRSHVLADGPGLLAPPLDDVLARVNYDNNGVLVVGEGNAEAATKMVCGHFVFREKADHPLLRALPDFLLITMVERLRAPWLDEMLRLVAQRIFSGEIGAAASVTRLSEIVFIELLRAGIDKAEGLRATFAAIKDKQIGRALQLIHNQPADEWTVERLASEVGMSRSRFSDRFSDLLNMGPMGYLQEWRLQKALALLDDRKESVQLIAEKTGYRSPAAFSRAFSGQFGVSPSQYRKAV